MSGPFGDLKLLDYQLLWHPDGLGLPAILLDKNRRIRRRSRDFIGHSCPPCPNR